MEIQLQELIDKIKKDGIEAATAEAAKLKSNAETEAGKLVAAAQKEAADIVSRAKADAERTERAGKAALEQASRNLVLAFKGEIQALLDKLVVQGVSAAYDTDTLKKVLPELLKAWTAKSGAAPLDLLLSEKELAQLKTWSQGALASELQKGLTLKSDRNLGAGFKIANKDGSSYYDFSAESVAELLSAYLNPQLAGILKAAVQSAGTKGI